MPGTLKSQAWEQEDILILKKTTHCWIFGACREDLEEAAKAAGFVANLWDSKCQRARHTAFLASRKELH